MRLLMLLKQVSLLHGVIRFTGKTHVQPVCIRNLMLVLEALSLPNLTGINMTYYCEYLHFQALMLINSR
jgi:hypothetical protein